MASKMFVGFWCFLVLGHLTAADLLLDTNPANISPGLTDVFTVNCSFSYDSLPNVASITSLTVLKDGTQLASVNDQAPGQVNELSQTNAVLSGQLDVNGVSFVSLQWTFPRSDASGAYSCQASVMDGNGQPSDIPANAPVTSSQADIDQLVNVLINVKEKLTAEEDKLLVLEVQNNKSANVLSMMFEKSSVYNGKRYMLYNQQIYHANVTQAQCEFFGGYLAEIDDQGENDFIIDFLNSYAFDAAVLLGATDEAQEGTWVFRHSGQPVVFTNWGANNNQPSDSDPDFDCMSLWRYFGWSMQAVPCYMQHNFLCEVPA